MAKKSKIEKAVNKQKKAHPIAFLLVVLFLAVGAVCGYFVTKHLTRNDKFEIIGEQTITINLGEDLPQDEGAVAISFGRDISSRIVVEDNINTEKAGRYYIKYTVDDIRYNGVVKYRYIIILAPEESGDIGDGENGSDINDENESGDVGNGDNGGENFNIGNDNNENERVGDDKNGNESADVNEDINGSEDLSGDNNGNESGQISEDISKKQFADITEIESKADEVVNEIQVIVEDEVESAIAWQDTLERAQFDKSDGESLDVLGGFLKLEAING